MKVIESDIRSARAPRAWLQELRAILALSWPIVATNLAQIAMGTTDIIMLGRLGAETLAAGSLGFNLYLVAMILGIGLVNATTPLVASALGRGGPAIREVRRTVRQGFWAASAVALVFWAVLWQARGILALMGQEPGLAAMAGTYVHALQWGLWPYLLYQVLRAFVSALLRPGACLAVALAAVLFNAAANECLIFGRLGLPAFGIAGSGMATTLSDVLMFASLAAIVSFDRQFRRYHLFSRLWRADWPRLRAFWKLGLPMAAMLSFEVSVFNAATFLMGLIGAAPLAAHAIAMQLSGLTFMVPLGIGQAVTVRVGRAFGARDAQAVARAGWTGFSICMAFATAASLTMVLAPRTLISAFLEVADPANADVVRLAVAFLAMAALFQIADGAQAVGAGMLRGLQDARVPMLFAMVGYWGIGLPLGIGLAFYAGFAGIGIWIGLAAGLAIVALLILWRWSRRASLGLLRARHAEGPLLGSLHDRQPASSL